jgi:hypothetical protein
MMQPLNNVQKLSQDRLAATLKAFGIASTGAKAIVTETIEYTKTSAEQGVDTFEKLLGVKSLNKTIEIQTGYIKSAYEGFVAHSTKTRELYTKLAQDSLAPLGAVRSAAEATHVAAKSAPRAK